MVTVVVSSGYNDSQVISIPGVNVASLDSIHMNRG